MMYKEKDSDSEKTNLFKKHRMIHEHAINSSFVAVEEADILNSISNSNL